MEFAHLVTIIASFVISTNANICQYSEVALVLDVSGSIVPEEWVEVKEFARNLVSAIGVSELGNHIGVVSFSDFAKKEIYCNEHTSVQSLSNAISNLTQYGDFTNIEDGLRKGDELLYTNGCGERSPPPSSRVIILMTDAEANRGGGYNGLSDISQEIRNKGILIYAVGVGGEANIDQLINITGDPKTVVTANNFGELISGDLISNLTVAVCTITVNVPITTPQALPTEASKTTLKYTATPESSTKPQPQDLCSCKIEQEFYPCIKWTKIEIIRKFNGTCYTDKLKAAIEYIKERIIDLDARIEEFSSCKADLRKKIATHQYQIADIFQRYDECTLNIVCKLQKWKEQLVSKAVLLKNELKLEVEGFGGLTMPNPWQYLYEMMKRNN